MIDERTDTMHKADETAPDHTEHAGDSRPHVVMMSANTVVVDARVLKYARTVAQFGVRVTAVGLSSGRSSRDLLFQNLDVVQVAVPARYRGAGLRARLRRLGHGFAEIYRAIRPWYVTQEEYRVGLAPWQRATRAIRSVRGRTQRDHDRPAGPAPQRPAPPGALLKLSWRYRKVQRYVLAAMATPLRFTSRRRRGKDRTSSLRGNGNRLALYQRFPRLARWRDVAPEIVDQELAIGPVLDSLRPDVVHVHDVYLLGAAAQHAHRAALDGRMVKVVYDAHEYVLGLANVKPRRVAAMRALEQEYLGDTDKIITVSPQIAEVLRTDYHLRETPDVVLNATVAGDPEAEVPSVRDLAEVPEDVPLLVYGGGVVYERGVHTVVGALPQLPGVHLVVVVKRANTATVALEHLAEDLAVRDRLHFAPYVDAESVPRYFRSATVGVSPLLHAPNHDMAITNKFCEYLAAGIPIVTSDTQAQAELVRDLDLGAVHRADDADDCARALREVLDRLPELRKRIADDDKLRHRFSWAAQAEKVREIYAELMGGLPDQAWRPEATVVRQLLAPAEETP
ncbi:glycosyltransferase family 4 protein [Jiangella alkaliphila]|nr:glycosyltransferase family 4 protein [Jiangella alkaliphila]